jgi:uncharacterized membrane protein
MDIIDRGKITGEGQMRAPTFFANEDDPDWMVEGPISAFAYFIAIIFGTLRLAGWNFYQSHIERDIWRVASIIITAVAVAAAWFVTTIFNLIKTYYIKTAYFSLY